MKRYLVFAGSHYYPAGGVDDLVSDHDDRDEAIAAAKAATDSASGAQARDWASVVDTQAERGVAEVFWI